MTRLHTLGFPRIGARRELKRALEGYWRGELDQAALEDVGRGLRATHWQMQADAGVDLLPVGDFSWYDQVLDMSCLLGAVPGRFGEVGDEITLDTYFRMARGRAPSGTRVPACEMTKWFDTNYHYIVPELGPDQTFRIASHRLFDEVSEAQQAGYTAKPVLIGPLSFLWLAKTSEPLDRLSLLASLLPVYGEVLKALREQGVEWVQIDEPILALDLPQAWKAGFERAYHRLQVPGLKVLLATYFGTLGDNLSFACRIPVAGLHVDLARAPEQLVAVLDHLPSYKVLSAGVIDGRNVWRADLDSWVSTLRPVRERLGSRLWLAPSCSLLHVPLDVNTEQNLDEGLKARLAFAKQKLLELSVLRQGLESDAAGTNPVAARPAAAAAWDHPVRPVDRDEALLNRNSPYSERARRQQRDLGLPRYPTTTIGSFPQTAALRRVRLDYRNGHLDETAYRQYIKAEIAEVIRRQEAIGLDVLVHGEAERSDMVEYFAEQLDGFATTTGGWVQSYGSRCVRPPIIYGEVSRREPMTVEWARYAQGLTERPVKGMLTGPVTLMQWSFVRTDRPRGEICRQIALALRGEVLDLEQAGIRIVQIDEPALREGMPLRQREWASYLREASECFRLAAGGVRDETQIHTHMCYSDFNTIIRDIVRLDADVITIEAARSDMALLDAFADFHYPNGIGPGIYDIHSPNVPSVEEMATSIEAAAERIPAERLWVNPDCGLKTRSWEEVEAALSNMVRAARSLR